MREFMLYFCDAWEARIAAHLSYLVHSTEVLLETTHVVHGLRQLFLSVTSAAAEVSHLVLQICAVELQLVYVCTELLVRQLLELLKLQAQ